MMAGSPIGAGRTVDFRKPCHHDLENLGSQVIQEYSAIKNYSRMRTAVMEDRASQFRFSAGSSSPDHDIVVFHPLGEPSRSAQGSSTSSCAPAQRLAGAQSGHVAPEDGARDLLA